MAIVTGQCECMLQGSVGRIQLACVGQREPLATAVQHGALQLLQCLTLLGGAGVVGLYQVNGTAPGMGAGQVCVLCQRACKVVQCGRKVVPKLAHHAAHHTQVRRHVVCKATHQCVGITHVARVALGQGQVKVPAGQLGGRLWVGWCLRHCRAQARQLARGGITRTKRQALNHLRVVRGCVGRRVECKAEPSQGQYAPSPCGSKQIKAL